MWFYDFFYIFNELCRFIVITKMLLGYLMDWWLRKINNYKWETNVNKKKHWLVKLFDSNWIDLGESVPRASIYWVYLILCFIYSSKIGVRLVLILDKYNFYGTILNTHTVYYRTHALTLVFTNIQHILWITQCSLLWTIDISSSSTTKERWFE